MSVLKFFLNLSSLRFLFFYALDALSHSAADIVGLLIEIVLTLNGSTFFTSHHNEMVFVLDKEGPSISEEP